MQLTTEFKEQVVKALLEKRKLNEQSDKRFAISMGLNNSVFSRLKKGETDKVLSEDNWLTLGRELDVLITTSTWSIAQTQMYCQMGDLIHKVKENSLSLMLIDRCGWGKSEAVETISKHIPGVVYMDCSQTKKKIKFIRRFAQKLGLDNRGKIDDLLDQVKYYLKLMDKPLIVLDEFGDMEYSAILLIKELWNATPEQVGWLTIGAEGLQAKIDKGIGSKKVGFAELFSRFAGEYIGITPDNPQSFLEWKRLELEVVAAANVKNPANINGLVKKCMAGNKDLRYLKNLIILKDY